VNPSLAAHHESSHAVACVVLGLPLQDTGIRIDTLGGGITFNLHREPGSLSNTIADITERERSIVMIKAGFMANLRVFPGSPAELAADDRDEEIRLLNEMHPQDGQAWAEADKRLSEESRTLVDQHWNAIQALAGALLARPVTPRAPESLKKWSRDSQEQWMDGNEVAAILRNFQLSAIVRSESQGTYYAPDIRPGL
jgi:hypothetical protein